MPAQAGIQSTSCNPLHGPDPFPRPFHSAMYRYSASQFAPSVNPSFQASIHQHPSLSPSCCPMAAFFLIPSHVDG